MKKRRLFSLFLSFALLLPLFSLTSADAYEDFTLDAKAGLLIEADTGEILYEKNAHQENYPASLTKVMVALLVFEAIDEGKIALTDSVTAPESAFEGLSSDGSTANIVPGETMTVEQLLNCMLIVSANEACNFGRNALRLGRRLCRAHERARGGAWLRAHALRQRHGSSQLPALHDRVGPLPHHARGAEA